MKLAILSTTNTKKGDITFPINEAYRPDLIKRSVLSLQSRRRQPYGADPRAGLKHATNVAKRRRKYRGSYGKGISRVPRKVLSRSGLQFYWKGAEAPGTVGGRRAHPPKAEKIWVKQINKKENRKAINSALCATLDVSIVQQRGHHVPKTYPFVLADEFETIEKTKQVRELLETLGFAKELERGENNAVSLLIITESKTLAKAAKNIPGVDAVMFAAVNAELLAPGTHAGRATLFTESSIKKMEEFL